MPALDRYDNEDLDDDEYDPMSVEDRVAAEQELRRRDRDEGRLRRDDRGLLYGLLYFGYLLTLKSLLFGLSCFYSYVKIQCKLHITSLNLTTYSHKH